MRARAAGYSIPKSIGVIDGSRSDADNTAWFNGTVSVGGVQTLLDRYASYGETTSTIAAALGTASKPYIIATGLELANLAALVNAGNSFGGKYIRIAGSKKNADQTVNNGSPVLDLIGTGGLLYQKSATEIGWVPCDSNNNNATGWTPIGNTQTTAFQGNLYADAGVKIYNLSINVNANTPTTYDNIGLFGWLGGSAVISGLHLADVQIYNPNAATYGGNTGALAGTSSTASISDCSVSGLAAGTRTATADGTVITNTDSGTGYTVPDFTIYNYNSSCSTGALVGRLQAAGTVSGISMDVSLVVNGGQGVGGVAGYLTCWNSTIRFTGISGRLQVATPTATTGSFYRVGGIIGEAGSGTVVIDGVGSEPSPLQVICFGRVNANGGGLGGLIGYTAATNVTGVQIGLNSACYVQFRYLINRTGSDRNIGAGGIVGRVNGGYVQISNCHVSNSLFSKAGGQTENNSMLSIGGILGCTGISTAATVAASYIRNSSVTDSFFSADGLFGGIVGTSATGAFAYIGEISGCTVQNVTISTQYNEQYSYLSIGGITASIKTEVVSSCVVKNFTVNAYVASPRVAFTWIGGIVGGVKGGSITGCTAVSVMNLVVADNSFGLNLTAATVGGICGYLGAATLSQNIAQMDYHQLASIDNAYSTANVDGTSASAKTYSVGSYAVKNTVVGGIAGYIGDQGVITGCMASGDYDVSCPSGATLGDWPNLLGGLVGGIGGMANITNSFSTASLSGNLQDGIGGLIGINNAIGATVSNCYFGGSILNPYGASVIYYSGGGTFSNLTYNKKWSPSALSADGGVSATDSSGVPASISSQLGTLATTDYFAAFTAYPLSFTGSHVFAVNNMSGNVQVTAQTATSGSVTVTRRVRMVKNLIDSAEDGCSASFMISNSTDLENMRQYVANGGGFLGASFLQDQDFSSGLSQPIGLADGQVRTAAEGAWPFLGRYDGQGHTLTLTAAAFASQAYNGLFGYIQNATIKNLNLIYAQATTMTANNYAGGLVGYAAYSTVDHVTVQANSGLTLNAFAAGGILGYAKSTRLNLSDTAASSFTGKLVGQSNVGGLIGQSSNTKPSFQVCNISGTSGVSFWSGAFSLTGTASNTSVFASYAAGDIIGAVGVSALTGVNASNTATAVGGLIGASTGSTTQIEKSYFFGNVTGGIYVGGLLGSGGPSVLPLIKNAYMSGDIYANNNAGGLCGYLDSGTQSSYIAKSCYFAGQIDCSGALGALTSGSGTYQDFYYDIQVAGNLPVSADAVEDSTAELSGSAMQSTLHSSGTPPTETVDQTVSPSSADTIGESTLTFYINGMVSTPAYSSTATATDTAWRYDDSRYLINTRNSGGKAAQIDFRGTRFTLHEYVYATSSASKRKIYVDGVFVPSTNATKITGTELSAYSSAMDWYKIVTASYTLIFAWQKNQALNSAYSAWPSGTVSGNYCDTVMITFTGSSTQQHQLRFEAEQTGTTTRYFSFYGYTYGWTETQNSFTAALAHYPQLSIFAGTNASLLSTEFLYQFSNQTDNTAHTFRPGAGSQPNTLTEASGTRTYAHTALTGTGITYSNGVYTAGQGGNAGSFTVTTTRSVGNYSLAINEKITVVPFAVGSGVKADPFQLRNIKELDQFRSFINNVYGGAGLYFKLTMDTTTPAHSADGNTYDLSGVDQTADGTYFTGSIAVWNTGIGTAQSPFQGSFDGNGKKITNLTINALQNGINSYGLFANLTKAAVTNLQLSGNLSVTTINRQVAMGLLAGVATGSTIENCTVEGTLDVGSTNNYMVMISPVIGNGNGNTTLRGILSKATVTVPTNRPTYMLIGGIMGYLDMPENSQNLTVDSCVFYGSISGQGATAGGIIGKFAANSTKTANITLNNNGGYGSIDLTGRTGSIIGEASNTVNWNITMTENFGNMTLISGTYTGSYYMGGLVGRFYSNNTRIVMNGNEFHGEINAIRNGSTNYVGGLVGQINSLISTASTGNNFDATKNPDLNANGHTSNVALFSSGDNGAKTTAVLLGSNGNYLQTQDLSGATLTYGGTAAQAAQIVAGHTVSLNLVRSDTAQYNNSRTGGYELDHYPNVTCVFVDGRHAASVRTDSSSGVTAFIVTNGNKRIVSTGNDNTLALAVQVVDLVGGVDQYGGFGKMLTYYPSVQSVGKADTSYLAANPTGDGLNTGNGAVFTIYTGDQLMGLDPLLRASGADGFGNPIGTAVSSPYSAVLANDLDLSGVNYVNDTSNNRTTPIGDASYPFTGTFYGNHHTIAGLECRSSGTLSGLFGVLSGAAVRDLGISDSAFSLQGTAGAAGSFAGQITNGSVLVNCYSSAKVELENSAPNGVYLGGLVGTSAGGAITDSFFTGAVGPAAASVSAFLTVSGTGSWFDGGIVGTATGATTMTGCYVASYVQGEVLPDGNAYLRNIGQFAASGGSLVVLSGCAADLNAGAESCFPLGDRAEATVGALTATNGFYPSKWPAASQSAREKAARIAAVFQNSASSMSVVEITAGQLSNANYGNVITVCGTAEAPLYELDLQFATRTNSGTASILISYSENGVTSYRILQMSLQCWYDNYQVVNGQKVYTIKNPGDLLELATMVEYGSDDAALIGHTHSSSHTAPGVASDRFSGALIQLGANLAVGGEVLKTIGTTAGTAFAGTFDGNGYTITNAAFETENGVAGLFGYLAPGALIQNVMLAGDSTVRVSETSGDVVAGGVLAHYLAGTLQNCYNSANITVSLAEANTGTPAVYLGGVTGQVGAGQSLTGCYNMGHLAVANDLAVYLGGIAASSQGTVTHCYNTGILEGFTNISNVEFVNQAVIGGISAANTGSVTECYNAGILRYFAADQMYPIANGTVSDCFADGQYLTPDYSYKGQGGGYDYSAGTRILSTTDMSGGAAFSTSWSGWTYESGYYPQFSIFYEGQSPIGGARKVSSTVSSLAGQLTPHTGEQTATFERFSALTFLYGSNAFNIVQHDGNVGSFAINMSSGQVKYTVLQRGVAVLYLNRSSGDVTFSRETYYINEETFTIRYMFDFSVLTADAGESVARTPEYTGNTFASGRLGTGSAGNPYLITTAEDLAAFASYVNISTNGGLDRYFKLTDNIDCTGYSWTPIGDAAHPFRGTFNGNGYTISGIASSGYAYNGLFGYTGEESLITLTAITGSVFSASAGPSWTGALVGYQEGTMTSCYSRSIVEVGADQTGSLYVGGLVGELGTNAVLQGCYLRPAEQDGLNVPAGKNNLVSYSSNVELTAGLLVGKTSGTISGCYHTAPYYEPTGYSDLTEYGVLTGWFAGGKIVNTFYDSTVLPSENVYLYLKYEDGNGAKSVSGNQYAKTITEMKTTESSAATSGVANDGMALLLSQDMYLGTYEMSALPSTTVVNGYQNDGYPLLTAFDIAQYTFTSFEASNLILGMQNVDAQEAKLMNSLGSYETYQFPTYADISAKAKLVINVFSLPKTMTYNVSAVGYGLDETGDLKWTAVNGVYTDSRALYATNNGIAGSGAGMIDNTAHDGTVSLVMGTTDCLPYACYKMYVYLTLKPSDKSRNSWGVYHDWDSSTLQELPEESFDES